MKRAAALSLSLLLLLTACAERRVAAPSSAPSASPAVSSEAQTAPSEAQRPSFEAPAASSEEERLSSEAPVLSSEGKTDPPGTASAEAPAEVAAGPEDLVPPDGDWRLILVNPWNALPAELEIDLVLPPSGRNPDRHKVDARIVDDLEAMIAAAKADGVDLMIDYGYRSFAQSEGLFEKQINSQLAAHPDYTREQAVEAAKRWVAPPGTSDHHTGLALDIVTPAYQVLDDGFAGTDAGRWMEAHSWEYGFVIRFPKDKTAITGIAYESWHLRYVGREHAAVMHENDWCLEEYLGALNAR